jgi:hypothetical protein
MNPDPMQFVLSQPMFLPSSPEPYYNPYAVCVDYSFKDAPEEQKHEPAVITPIPTEGMDRVNRFYLNRVNMLLQSLEERPLESGTHQYLYSVLKRLYPYINQQTAISETELTQRLERIIEARYRDRSQIPALHRSIERARYPEQSLIDLVNQTAKVKI